MIDKLFVATKALVEYNGKILLLRESGEYEDGTNTGFYDVPGGRVKPGERYDESLLREIKEETGLDASIERPIHVDEWRPAVRGEQWQIVGIFFICHADSDVVTLSADHAEYVWIDPREYEQYNIIPMYKRLFAAYLAQK